MDLVDLGYKEVKLDFAEGLDRKVKIILENSGKFAVIKDTTIPFLIAGQIIADTSSYKLDIFGKKITLQYDCLRNLWVKEK